MIRGNQKQIGKEFTAQLSFTLLDLDLVHCTHDFQVHFTRPHRRLSHSPVVACSQSFGSTHSSHFQTALGSLDSFHSFYSLSAGSLNSFHSPYSMSTRFTSLLSFNAVSHLVHYKAFIHCSQSFGSLHSFHSLQSVIWFITQLSFALLNSPS